MIFCLARNIFVQFCSMSFYLIISKKLAINVAIFSSINTCNKSNFIELFTCSLPRRNPAVSNARNCHNNRRIRKPFFSPSSSNSRGNQRCWFLCAWHTKSWKISRSFRSELKAHRHQRTHWRSQPQEFLHDHAVSMHNFFLRCVKKLA